jgi:TRAP-type C4-dicarboxylate transport system substrate-binding protein
MSRFLSHPEVRPASGAVASPGRRRFLAVAERYGFTTAVLASSGGYLWSDRAVAQAAADEAAKAKAAKHTMIFATEYKLDAYKTYPIMQEAFKENLEKASDGALYVRLHPAGQLGVGAALGQKVQGGTVHGGALSLSNFSPFAPVVDVINIPFWCGENQRFANLVTSKTWADEINPRVNAKNFKPMFYYTVDPRTIAARKGLGRIIKTPEDMRGVKMRIPPSKLLGKFYQLAGANPTIVPWGETPTALKQGVADALDPAIGALYTFGFIDILESISAVASVPDAQMFACNLAWYNKLPKDLQDRFEEASEMTQEASFRQIEVARKTSIDAMSKAGVKFYKPTESERKQWAEACGEQRAEWDEHKVELAGSTANFDKLRTAANTKGRYTVGDYQG